MKFPNFSVYANDANISGLYNPAKNFTFTPGSKITDLINQQGNSLDVINLVFVFIGLYFFANLIMAGWDYMLSSGDPKKAATASARMTNGLTGIVMAFMAFVIVRLIGRLLGLDTANQNII